MEEAPFLLECQTPIPTAQLLGYHRQTMAHEFDRRIVLVDLDAFYASVEVNENPELRGKPLLIGGSPEGRGVVAAASYEARTYGCRSAMPMATALRLCPHATVLPVRHGLYSEYSRRVMDILHRESDTVQQMSIDEAYVDLTAVVPAMEAAAALAHRIQGRIRVESDLPCSIGLGTSKMVAKVACETGKPSGFIVVQPGAEATFLAPLPVKSMPGVGPRSAERLNAAGFRTLGDVAHASLAGLIAVLGPWGAILQRRARGEDDSIVTPEREAKSISAEETFAHDVTDRETLHSELERMAQRIGDSLARSEVVARTVTLKLRFADFTTITRSQTSSLETADPRAILGMALELLERNWQAETPLRLIGVGVSNLRSRHTEGQLAMEGLAPYKVQ